MDDPNTACPDTGKPDMVNPCLENRTQLNKDKRNTDLLNTERIKSYQIPINTSRGQFDWTRLWHIIKQNALDCHSFVVRKKEN